MVFMLLWTIQTEQVYEASLQKGFVESLAEYVDEEFGFAYSWMIQEMRKRLEPPPREDSFPVWAWAQYRNAARARPDLRRAAHLPKWSKGVRIEFKTDTALLSCFTKWHHVLNRWYIPLNNADDKAFDTALLQAGYDPGTPFDALPVRFQDAIRQSWSRVFDLRDDSGYFRSADHSPTQATLWRIPISSIIRVTPFTAR